MRFLILIPIICFLIIIVIFSIILFRTPEVKPEVKPVKSSIEVIGPDQHGVACYRIPHALVLSCVKVQ